MTALGDALRQRRRELGLSLATVAGRVGCGKSYLSAIERGRKGPPADGIVERLEVALSVTGGSFAKLAAWDRTPEDVRARAVASARERDAAYAKLARLIAGSGVDGSGSTGLDAAYRSGELRSLIDLVSPAGDGGPGSADASPAGGTASAARGGLGGADEADIIARAIGGELSPLALPREVPLINRVAAGYPAGFTDLGFPARVADEYVRCPDIDDPDAFAARIIGDSMDPAYREGDVVVFSPARDIADGDDCFARLEPDHESTFKRVYFERDGDGHELIRLQPVNNRYAPRTVPREAVAGLYRAVTVMRSL